MNNKTKTIFILISGIFLLILGFKSMSNFTFLAIIELIIGILLILKSAKLSKIEETENNNNINKETKECKYCKSSININAKICPNCRKTLDFSFSRVLIGLLIGFLLLIAVVSTSDAMTVLGIVKAKFIYSEQLLSIPFSAQYEKYDFIISDEYGFIIAADKPFPNASVKNALFNISRSGNPKETFETPRDV